MNNYLVGVAKKIVLQPIKDFINFKIERRIVNDMCVSGAPFIGLESYSD